MVIEPGGIPKTPDTARLIPRGEDTFMDLLAKFFWEEAGASAVEYGLLMALIAMAIMVSVTMFGAAVRDSFLDSTSKLFP